MKFKKLVSSFLGFAMFMTMFTAFPVFAASDEFSDTVVQTVFEMDVDSLKAGNEPAGVTLNKGILDSTNSSSTNGLISNVMSSQTPFLTIDLAQAVANLPGEDTGLYTIEAVVNQNDSDSSTLNGILMSMTGVAKKDVWRVREDTDIAVLNTWTSDNSIFSNGKKSAATASYVFTDLNIYTGAIASHAAKYGTNPAYNGFANGQSVAAGNASKDKPINIIEIRTATTSNSGAMRANIKSLKITRKATFASDKYVKKSKPVYTMNIADVVSGKSANGITYSNVDTTNSTANALLSAYSDTSADFMTVNLAKLDAPTLENTEQLTNTYRMELTVNLIDGDSNTKNGTVVYFNERNDAHMLLRARETRDGTVYETSTNKINGEIGSQTGGGFGTVLYDCYLNTDTKVLNQYFKRGSDGTYIYGNTLSHGDDITLSEVPQTIIIRNADYNSNGVNEDYRVNIKSLTISRLVYSEIVKHSVSAVSEDTNHGTVEVTGVTDGEAVEGNSVTLRATAQSGYVFDGWYDNDTLISKENPYTFSAEADTAYTAKFSKEASVVAEYKFENVNGTDYMTFKGTIDNPQNETVTRAGFAFVNGEAEGSKELTAYWTDNKVTDNAFGAAIEKIADAKSTAIWAIPYAVINNIVRFGDAVSSKFE